MNIGTPYYMAPELWKGGAYYDTKVDIWAFGMVIYEMLSKKTLV